MTDINPFDNRLDQFDCEQCRSDAKALRSYMICCPICGNKRCPKALNHIYKCTGSNATDQVGVTDIKVGDWVVSTWGLERRVLKVALKPKKKSGVLYITLLIDGVRRECLAQWWRLATAAEIAAGHRIDEPVKEPDSGREGFDLAAFRIFLQSDIGISDVYRTNKDVFLRGDAQDMYVGAKWAWQARQAEVDGLKDAYAGAREDLLNRKNQALTVYKANIDLEGKLEQQKQAIAAALGQVKYYRENAEDRGNALALLALKDIEKELQGVRDEKH